MVLGMHRTGSSLLTSVLHDLGFNPGKELLQANEFNQEGYWEYKPLVEFHNRMLADHDNQWFAPGHLMLLDELLLQYRNEAESLINEMDADDKDWCWKDPRLILFLDFWLEILSNRPVKWIITHRNPSAIAHSLKSRDHFDIEIGLTLWEYSMLNLMAKKDRLKDSITVQYEEMLSDPKTQIKRIISFLHPQWDDDTRLSRGASAADRIKIDAVHHRDPSDVVLSEKQQWLEKILRQELEPPDNIAIGTHTHGHRIFFRKLYRETQGMTIQKKYSYECMLAAERQKSAELYQVINRQQKQLDQMAHFRSSLFGRIFSMLNNQIRTLKGQ